MGYKKRYSVRLTHINGKVERIVLQVRNLQDAIKFVESMNSQTNTNGTLPGIATTKSDALPGNAGWDLGRQDASFVRVRNITFGYNLQGKYLGKVLSKRIDGIRLYVDFQNPFTFTTFSGVDPEIYIGNSSSPAGYPMTRSYSLGAKFNFK